MGRLECWVFLIAVSVIVITGVDCKRKFDGDFEFAEEDDTKILKVGDKKLWINDPNSELCRPLNCKKKELCLLEDTFTAVCVSKKELHKSGDIVMPKSRNNQRRMHTDNSIESENDDAFFDSEDDDEDQDESKCQECPVVKPNFLCGIDNRTYSSPCRLEYHNCIHHTSIHIACKGFCPCKDGSDLRVHTKKFLQIKPQKSLLGKLGRNRDITLMPRDFNFDNHHYQYLKYGKRIKGLGYKKYEEDIKHSMGNEINKSSVTVKSTFDAAESKSNIPGTNDCSSASKSEMANRLLDWFSVVMADAKYRRQHTKSKGHFPTGCQTEVRWMFGHFDTDGDRKISLSELYGLEHDQNEPCLKPFIDACDTNGDISISGQEWCACFSKAERPCAAVRRRTSPDVAPMCDSRGYFRSVQCHSGLGLCWCVDPHGVEFAGTRTRGFKPNCDGIFNKITNDSLKTNSVNIENIEMDNDDEDSDTGSVNDLEGSADQPLDF
ncbi:proteoglycan Cow [Diachasma alloeum]|uniref:proteoglycan Cow n=1 Tax=Diachasma alloeum TaxID=454923 RepID=UPI0007385185|nr:proteoglycan Cow [Diachasma alloeum]XP_015120184.1 proteoglycan Cow [Diachasma alloeum]XP_015120185.1 proteoglycan Cow [Diachasma alloeum]